MKPKTGILNPTFKYTPAAKTDLAKTFRRIRREQSEQANQPVPVAVVRVIGSRK